MTTIKLDSSPLTHIEITINISNETTIIIELMIIMISYKMTFTAFQSLFFISPQFFSLSQMNLPFQYQSIAMETFFLFSLSPSQNLELFNRKKTTKLAKKSCYLHSFNFYFFIIKFKKTESMSTC